MFNYQEYKQLQELSLAGMKAAIAESNESGIVPEMNLAGTMMATIVEALGWEDRLADFNSVKGFLGFMLMVSRFPNEFNEDKAFWVEVHVVGCQLMDMMVQGQDPELVEIIMSDPDVVMGKRFIVNSAIVIK